MKDKKVKQTLFKTCQKCGKKVLHRLRFNNGNPRYYPNSEKHEFADKRVYLFDFDWIDTPAEKKKEKERKRKKKKEKEIVKK